MCRAAPLALFAIALVGCASRASPAETAAALKVAYRFANASGWDKGCDDTVRRRYSVKKAGDLVIVDIKLADGTGPSLHLTIDPATVKVVRAQRISPA